jgi:hypothetical protein
MTLGGEQYRQTNMFGDEKEPDSIFNPDNVSRSLVILGSPSQPDVSDQIRNKMYEKYGSDIRKEQKLAEKQNNL